MTRLTSLGSAALSARVLILAAIGLVALLELCVEIALNTTLASPTFGPLRFRGHPAEALGSAWFLAVLATELAIRASPPDIAARFRLYRFVVSIVGLGIVLWAATARGARSLPVQYWIAGACAVAIFVDCASTSSAKLLPSLRFAWSDLSLFSRRATTWIAVVAVVAVIGWAPRTWATESVRSGSEFEQWYRSQPRVPFPIPIENPGVVIVEFVDYQCPFCREAEARYQTLIDELRSAHGHSVRFVRYDFPLETECNDVPGMRDVHPAACEAAAAVRLADTIGRAPMMRDWLWANQSTVSRSAILDELRRFNITDPSAHYPALLERIRMDVKIGQQLGIDKTPMFWINGVLLSGVSRQSFKWAVLQELAARQPATR
jgi:hypothetical protein